MKKIIRLNEDDLTRIVRRVIIEQKLVNEQATEQTSPKPDVSCLENAGYKKGKEIYGINNNGEKIPYESVYEGTYNGNQVSLSMHGFVFYRNNKYNAKWKCENGNLVVYDVKSVPQMKVPF